MEIKYELTPQHLIDFQKITYKNDVQTTLIGNTFGGIIAVLVLVDFVYCFVIGSIPFSLSSFIIYFAVRVLIIFLLLIGIICFSRFMQNKYAKIIEKDTSKNGLFCEHKIILNEEELIEITDVNFARYSWSGIGEITENEKFVLIPINLSSTFTIPKESFESIDSLKEFIDNANEYRQNAQLRFNSSYFTRYEIES
jgi:hypothetical protein